MLEIAFICGFINRKLNTNFFFKKGPKDDHVKLCSASVGKEPMYYFYHSSSYNK